MDDRPCAAFVSVWDVQLVDSITGMGFPQKVRGCVAPLSYGHLPDPLRRSRGTYPTPSDLRSPPPNIREEREVFGGGKASESRDTATLCPYGNAMGNRCLVRKTQTEMCRRLSRRRSLGGRSSSLLRRR